MLSTPSASAIGLFPASGKGICRRSRRALSMPAGTEDPFDLQRFVDAQHGRLRSSARGTGHRPQTQPLDVVHLPAGRGPRLERHVPALRHCLARGSGRLSHAPVAWPSIARVHPARDRHRRAQHPRNLRQPRRHEVSVLDDAVLRGDGRQHATSSLPCRNTSPASRTPPLWRACKRATRLSPASGTGAYLFPTEQRSSRLQP